MIAFIKQTNKQTNKQTRIFQNKNIKYCDLQIKLILETALGRAKPIKVMQKHALYNIALH